MNWIRNLKVFFQSNEQFAVNFQTNPLSVRKMKWLNEPQKKKMKDHCLWIEPEGKTDLWQKTIYNYAHDSAHFLYYKTNRNFAMETECLYKPVNLNDQGGLAVRIDSQNWIKAAVEYNPDDAARLVTVVTNNGYSDAASQILGSNVFHVKFRITRTGQDFIIEANFATEWQTIRLTHLHSQTEETVCGLFAASPQSEGCRIGFRNFKLWEV